MKLGKVLVLPFGMICAVMFQVTSLQGTYHAAQWTQGPATVRSDKPLKGCRLKKIVLGLTDVYS